MSRLLKIVAVVVLVVLAVGGFAFWQLFLRDDAPPPAALPDRSGTTAAPGATIAPGAVDGAWTVQPGTDVFVGYRIQEQFGGDTFKKTAVGRTPAVTGTMQIDGGNVTATSVSADLTQLASGQGRRDRYIQTHGLEITTFPTATFVLALPIDVSGASPGGVLDVNAVGDLTLHGVTKRVTMPLEARLNASTVDVSGSLDVVLADYGIQPPAVGGFVTVDDKGVLELQLTLTRTT